MVRYDTLRGRRCVVNRVPVDALIFVCPMSAYNESLLEDRAVNRLVSWSSSYQLQPSRLHMAYSMIR